MSKRKHSKQSKAKQSDIITKDLVKDIESQIEAHEAKTDNPITEKRIIRSNGEPVEIVNEDKDGNLILTPEDKEKYDILLAKQAKAKQAKIDAKQALADAQEALQSYSSSGAVKAMLSDIEARLAKQEDIVTVKRSDLDTEIEKLQSIQSEYQSLTGIDKKIKGVKSKTKTNGNGKFDTKINQDDDAISVLVTHKETGNLFEYSLYPANGSISKDHWLKLRHAFTAQFEEKTQEENLTLRAYLSNLKTKIEAVKAIA